MNDEQIKAEALAFARANRRELADKLTDITKYPTVEFPVSVFMAGSPGAGKTEFSRNLLFGLEQRHGRILRIDGDEVRTVLPGYNGKNSHLFQGAVSLVVEKIHDLALSKKQNFILDGTLFKYEKAVDNIKRSLKRARLTTIFFVYQDPKIAWQFTQAREKKEGRNIPKQAFIEQFFGSRETVCRLRQEFKSDLFIYLIKKNFVDNSLEFIEEIAWNGQNLDEFIPEQYSKEELETLL